MYLIILFQFASWIKYFIVRLSFLHSGCIKQCYLEGNKLRHTRAPFHGKENSGEKEVFLVACCTIQRQRVLQLALSSGTWQWLKGVQKQNEEQRLWTLHGPGLPYLSHFIWPSGMFSSKVSFPSLPEKKLHFHLWPLEATQLFPHCYWVANQILIQIDGRHMAWKWVTHGSMPVKTQALFRQDQLCH